MQFLFVLQSYNIVVIFQNNLTDINLFKGLKDMDMKRENKEDDMLISDHIKTEIKEEPEDESLAQPKGIAFICSICGADFFYEKFFVEHIRDHHVIVTSNKAENNDGGSKTVQPNSRMLKLPDDKIFKCHLLYVLTCVFFVLPQKTRIASQNDILKFILTIK